MTSLIGPQWLCDCNKSGGAKNVAEAGREAARHFLGHEDEEKFAVAVYRERGKWEYSIRTDEEAAKLLAPAPFTHTFGNPPPVFTRGVDIGNMPLEEAAKAFQEIMAQSLRVNWNASGRTV